MRMKNELVVLAVCLMAGWMSGNALARETIAPDRFHYLGGTPEFAVQGKVYSVWNANDPKNMLSPGLKVTFFGQARGCDENAFNGPVAAKGNPRVAQAANLTGLALDPAGLVWTPSGDADQCGAEARKLAGDSFVHVNSDPQRGGIGLFTYTGRDTAGREPFFQQYDSGGRKNTGANANINGTFVAFRFDWKASQRIAPWQAPPGGRVPDVEFRTVQTVAGATVSTRSGRNAGDKPVQAKQQMVLALINRACFEAGGGRDRLCQLKYLFNVAVFRSGVKDLHAERWFRDAGVFLDPAQGGIPIVHGPLQGPDAVVSDKRTDLPLYTSDGARTQEKPFDDTKFAARISFPQLKNALRVIAAIKSRKAPAGVTDSDMAGHFGDRWDDPREWLVLSVNVSQEVSNPERNERAFIGGNVKEIYAGPR